MIEEPSGDSWSLWGWAQTFKVIFNRMNSVSEWIWKRICTLVTRVGVRSLNQHSQESIHQDVLPKNWDVNTRKLIIIKAFVTLGRPKANNWENVLGSVLCAFSVLPRFHPFAQVFSETPPPPLLSLSAVLPGVSLLTCRLSPELPGHLSCPVSEGTRLSYSSPGTPQPRPLNTVDV